MQKVKILNTYANDFSMEEALQTIDRLIQSNRKSYVVAINVDVIIKIENDIELKDITDNADMVLVDGKPLIWISRFHGHTIKEKISGSDFVPRVCEMATKKNYSLFIIGGKEGVAERAKQNLIKKHSNIKIVGTYAPPMGFEKNKEELDKINNIINDAKPDILIACFGCPKQEKWVYDNYNNYNAKVSICAGATVDFLAGNINRAPKWMSNHGLEWFYRFLQEPTRMFKRYFIDDVKIVKLMWKYRKG